MKSSTLISYLEKLRYSVRMALSSEPPKALLADKAYTSQQFREELRRRHIKVVIPDRSNTRRYSDGRVKFDNTLYRLRNVVERCFCLLKEKRRISNRYEKTARNYLSMIKLGCIWQFLMLLSN
ncbi:transposase [Photobacterium swingsii]|uniref:transposase n=1 Tax=Photobacterium swingsii TaxID=680026 RepID=UPI004069014F